MHAKPNAVHKFHTRFVTCSMLSDMLCRMQLRQQREVIEGLVDDVVECFHNGFAKAIHNYSQILQLFSDSRTQVRCFPFATPC